jgi:hypothetical protein
MHLHLHIDLSLQLMMHVLDVRDCLDTERFVQVHFDPNSERDVPSKSSGGSEQPVQGPSNH